MRTIVFLLMWLPSVVYAENPLNKVTQETISESTGIHAGQIIDGDIAAKAFLKHGLHEKALEYQPILFSYANNREHPERVHCENEKLFSVNADDPNIAGTHTEYNVLQIIIGICKTGAFSKYKIDETVKAVDSMLDSQSKKSQVVSTVSSDVGKAETLTFLMLPIAGHGVSYFPTVVAHAQDMDSIVVQIHYSDYINNRLGSDSERDTEITAPLRKALNEPKEFSISIMNSIRRILR